MPPIPSNIIWARDLLKKIEVQSYRSLYAGADLKLTSVKCKSWMFYVKRYAFEQSGGFLAAVQRGASLRAIHRLAGSEYFLCSDNVQDPMKRFQLYPSALATKEGKRTIKLYNRVSGQTGHSLRCETLCVDTGSKYLTCKDTM